MSTDAMQSRLGSMIASDVPTLVEFYADWCPHCRRMMPVVAELRADAAGKANIVQVEGDEHPSLMDEYGVQSFPTFVLFKSGAEVWRQSGEMSLDELSAAIQRYA